jgi:pimeloyl-ACP methyl ester carboxylesterase
VPTVRANGLEIGFEVAGSGPPIVLLHGATSAGREDFAAQIPLLARAFRVYAPDARGHATTRWDVADGWSSAWLVDDLLAFADAVGLPTFHLVGFSMGGLTGLWFAVRHPERLRTLVAIGVSTEREPRTSVARHLMDPDRIDRAEPSWATELSRRHDPVQGPGAWRRLLPAIAGEVALQAVPTPAQIHGIECPTLVVVGDRDPFAPVEHAARLARQVGDGRLLVVPDGGHEVMVRRPGLFNEALAGFYRSTEAIARSRAEHGAATLRGRRLDAGSLAHPAADEVPQAAATDARWLESEARTDGSA